MSDVIVAAVSDLHGHLPDPEEFSGCDLLVIAGDVCPWADHSASFQRAWLEDVFAPWLESLPVAAVAGVAGNHDHIFAASEPPFVPYLPWRYLQDEAAELCGLRVYGSPWIPHMSRRWAFQAPKRNGGRWLADRFWTIPDGLDVLITHSPPWGACDTVAPNPLSARWVEGGLAHEGSRALRGALAHHRPRLHICGHIHEGRGRQLLGGEGSPVLVANVAYLNGLYLPSPLPIARFRVPAAPLPIEQLS